MLAKILGWVVSHPEVTKAITEIVKQVVAAEAKK
jgi:hypothetical protein